MVKAVVDRFGRSDAVVNSTGNLRDVYSHKMSLEDFRAVTLEGWGTYRASRNIAIQPRLIGRDHAAACGLWIKSDALLRRVKLSMPGTSTERLEFAARHICRSVSRELSGGNQNPSLR
jgi:hypothetical protein